MKFDSIRTLFSRTYFKNIGILLGGAGLSQVVLIAASPVITRLYSPEDFGYFEVFYSVVSVLTAVACLQYDVSIYTAKDQKEGINAWASTFLVVIFVCVLIAACITIFKDIFLSITGAEIKEAWEWAVPVYIFFSAGFTLLLTWFTKQGEFKLISITRIILSIMVVACQISFGIADMGYWGLVSSTISVQAITFIFLFFLFIRKYNFLFREITMAGIKANLKSNKHLPLIVWPGNFLNTVTQNLPAFFLARIDATVLGFYSLSRRILGMPIAFMSSSVQSIFMKEATDEYAKTGKAVSTYKKNLILLSIFGIVVITGILSLGHWLIPLVFGSEWAGSVQYIYLLSILYAIRFISGSLSFVMLLGKGPKVDIFWQVTLFSLTYVIFSVIPENTQPINIVLVYCLATSIYYLLYMLQSYSVAKNPDIARGLFRKL